MGDWTAVSLFAGIGGFEQGLARAGVRTVASVEIDDKARGVLKHRFPDVALFNDVREVTANDFLAAGFNPERGILTAGFPCQDVSLAGKRAGLAGSRTGLFWEIIRIAEELKPKWFLLENVPGLLNSNGGRDMGTVVRALAELGYGVGWRVLDAQHFGVPQRRRRVFLAGCLGDIARAGEVLLEPESLAGDSATSGEAGASPAGAAADGTVRRGGAGLLAERGLVQGLTSSLGTGGPDAQHAQAGWLIPEKVANTLTARYQKGVNSTIDDGALAVSFRKSKRARSTDDDESWVQENQTNTLNCFDVGETRSTQLVTVAAQGRVVSPTGEISHTLTAEGFDASEDGTGRGWPTIGWEWGVRRLTPMECERLQGFPDDHTAERWDYKKSKVVAQSDSARGHQIGNAVAVPVISWIANRIVNSEA
jgi:DNA (cytosine-5)-methyltransferase 1